MALEDFFNLEDPDRRAKLLWFFYLISLGMMLLGFFFIFLFWSN